MLRAARRGQPVLVAAFTIGYLLFALAALELTSGEDGIAAVWPPSGIFLAGLLVIRTGNRWWLVGGVALASMVANVWGGSGPFAAAGYTIANLAEGFLALAIMNRLGVTRQTFERPLSLAIFAFASVVAAFASAAMAAVLSGNWDRVFFLSWASTVALGMLIVTPVILFLFRARRTHPGTASMVWVWTTIMVGGLTVLAFGQNQYPLLVLPMVAVLFATLTHGLQGTAISILVVTVIGSVLTVMDRGPVSLFFATVEQQVLYFQVYLVALLVSVLPLAAMLARHRRHLRDIADSHARLEAAERMARFGHWRYRVAENTVDWSSHADGILGLGARRSEGLDSILERVTPADRDRVSAALEASLRNGLPSTFEAHMVGPRGMERTVEARVEADYSEDGEISELMGTLRDVTDGYSYAARFSASDTPREG